MNAVVYIHPAVHVRTRYMHFYHKSPHQLGGFSFSHFMFWTKCDGSLADRNKLRPFIHSGSTMALACRCIGMWRTLAWRTPSFCSISGCSFYNTVIRPVPRCRGWICCVSFCFFSSDQKWMAGKHVSKIWHWVRHFKPGLKQCYVAEQCYVTR